MRAWDNCGGDGALEVERVQHVTQHALADLPATPGEWVAGTWWGRMGGQDVCDALGKPHHTTCFINVGIMIQPECAPACMACCIRLVKGWGGLRMPSIVQDACNDMVYDLPCNMHMYESAG